ncbi:sulfatase-like hydrolase/transferase [Tardiphaga sp. vice352]|nr:sulfatase-like hydrolase/transferase [Tardiphaga sp. vice278]QDM24231.1 sulfatase-like hydrolase/transferase [Tardiphaga sp. vice154]QDM29423.1 sulfatase-like hydrolase/transferase [Tardiphaga sp. vice304]QDM34536.1 sulfatase-like hydrolase/transferase [Tardiphaga sp. vice352]
MATVFVRIDDIAFLELLRFSSRLLYNMVLTLILLIATGFMTLSERSVEHLLFAIAALFINSVLFLLIVADVERAVLLSCIMAATITGASIVKYNHSALKLVVTDLPLVFAGTVPFFVTQYPRVVLAVVAGALILTFASAAVLLWAAGSPISLEFRMLSLSLTLIGLAAAFRVGGNAASSQQSMTQRRFFYSTFMASLIDPRSWRQFGKLALSDIANEPLTLMEPVPARSTDFPDIIILQHESIFDPRIFGLPVEPIVASLLSPENGCHGRLNVDIFGGGSWQSEFSLLTGLSSASFGSSAYYLFKRGVGRFRSSLPHSLAALGYKTSLASSCRRRFLNYDEFYSSIGVNERIFTDDLPPPFDVSHFESTNSDALFLDAVIDMHSKKIAHDPTPRFLYALTNFNHGPHNRRLVPLGKFEKERAFAAASLPDARYAEYYARLVETASTWQRLRSELKANFPGRPMLIVHYGDHQPVMAGQIDRQLQLPSDARRAFRTFYAIEALNFIPDNFVAGPAADLDIAFLGTIALQKAGLPLDQVYATRASLLDDCGESYFASSSELKRKFHRTLVDLGLINLGPHCQNGR